MQATENGVCEKVLAHWQEHRAVLPEAISNAREVIDGIPETGNEELLAALRRYC